jgi:hypothetical protein
MANIPPAVTHPTSDSIKVIWATVTESDTPLSYKGMHEYADRSVQFVGTEGGSTMTFAGSNDGTNFETLNDPFGTAISLSAAGLRQVLEYTEEVKPIFTGGSSQSMTVTMVAKRGRG